MCAKCNEHSGQSGFKSGCASASGVGRTESPQAETLVNARHILLSASLYLSKRGAYLDRLCRDVVGRWSLVVTRVHCGQTVHPMPIVTMEH